MLEKYQNYIVAGILAIMLAISIGTALGDAAIMDEVAHIPSGYSYVRYGDYRLNPEHPPLLKDLAGIPLQFLNLTFPTDDKFWTTDANGQWEAGWKFMYLPENDTEKLIFWSRFPIILLSLLLGFLIFKWAQELFGAKAGLLALSLYAFDPNILGHNHYVTTDLGIAAFSVFAFYFFVKYLKNPGWKTIILGRNISGTGPACQIFRRSAFPYFRHTPAFIRPLPKEKLKFFFFGFRENKKILAQKSIFLFRDFHCCSGHSRCSLIGLVYEANIFNMPPVKIHQLIDTQLYGGTQNPASPYLHKMADNAILRPYAQYLTGFFMVFGRVAGGNTTYFFGQVTNQSFREYFPMVFLIKETLPLSSFCFFLLAVGITMIL